MKLMLLFACGSMLHLGSTGMEEPGTEAGSAFSSSATSTTESATVTIPEPNMMLFAGIGGLTLLVFAIRRK